MLKAEVIPAIFALCAAFSAAVGSVIRQRSAQHITEGEVGHLKLFSMLVRNRQWWLGGLGDIASYIFLAIALDHGSVMLVTSLQVTVLLFAMPIYAQVTKHRITNFEWMWAVVLATALAVVIAVGHPKEEHDRGAVEDWIIVAIVLGPALALCVLGARIWRGRPVAAVLLGAVSGSALAVFAVLTKAIVNVVHHGGGHLLHTWEFYFWILAGVAGMIFQQSAFRAGSLTASLPTITVAKPVVAVALGLTVLKETLNADGPKWALLIAATVTVIVATVMLARGEAASMSSDEGHEVDVADQSKVPLQEA